MIFKYKYWFFNQVFSKAECRKIIRHGLSKKNKLAVTVSEGKKKLSKKEKEKLKEIRNSNLVWLKDRWLVNRIVPYLRIANKNAGWNFEFDAIEDIQFTIYKKGQHYKYHQDSMPGPYDSPENPTMHGKIRKLSMSICLSDSDDYQGGDFKILIQGDKDPIKLNEFTIEELKPQGSIIVFPSDQYHCVTPITKGTRYSLVVWCLGKPFQ